jgi:hypothetical protein
MATAQATSNKTTFRNFNDAVNSGDIELISNMIDEVFEPDVQIRTPLRSKRPGRKHSSKCGRSSFGPTPTFTSRSRI